MNDAVTAFETRLTHADDRMRLSHWLPLQLGVVLLRLRGAQDCDATHQALGEPVVARKLMRGGAQQSDSALTFGKPARKD
jgi:hypothetical protein